MSSTELSDNALTVLRERYLAKNDAGIVTETPSELWERVAREIAQVEALYGATPQDTQHVSGQFTALLASRRFLPNSPTLMNAGREGAHKQYSACFVIPIDDDMRSIGNAVAAALLIHKCLVPETLVMTNSGLIELKDVLPNQKIVTDDQNSHVSECHHNGQQPVFTVTTEHGYQLTGTDQHQIQVVDSDGERTWRRIQDLKAGDWAVFRLGQWLGANRQLPAFTYSPKLGRNQTSFKARRIALPVELCQELAEFLGLYMGDGANHRDGIRISVGHQDADLIERIRTLSQHLFQIRPVVSPSTTGRCFEVALLSVVLKKWFDTLGFTKTSAQEAHVPKLILQSEPQIAQAFLRGLFSADGCVRKGYCTLSTTSLRLTREVQTMLLHLGIPTRLYKQRIANGLAYYVSVVTRRGVEKFRHTIGFSDQRKAKILAGINIEDLYVRAEYIPGRITQIREWYNGLNSSFRQQIRNRGVLNLQGRELTNQRLATLSEICEASTPSWINEVLSSQFFYSRITAVTFAGIRDVLDLTVPGKHAYLANGFVSHNSGGGTGFSFSNIRPKGDRVRSSGGIASGPVSFMKILDTATEQVRQGGTRRGANMGILHVTHPDILDFVSCKSVDGQIRNFNISVAVTDSFMQAVRDDGTYMLINPRTQQPSRELSARMVFNRIVEEAWKTGDPGLFFIDRANRSCPIPHLGSIIATNPCGEQPLHGWDACTLGSIDLAKHVSRNSSTGEPVINWSDLKESVWWAVRFLDNVIDANDHPLPQINERTRETRRIGLGIMGHARLLMELAIAYDSEEGLRLTQDLSERLRRMAWEASEALAESRGVYPAWHGSEHEKSGHRVRNSYVTTVAPTGTISMIADTSAGCEPEFALVWYKNVLEGKRLPYICDPFFRIGQQEGWWHPGLIDEIVSNHGSCRGLAAIPKRCQEVFGIAHDIAPEWHVRMQAAWQHFSDTAVSKTINLPESATLADVRTAYQRAWDLDCSGITVYRDGSRADQVLNLGAIEHQASPPASMNPSGASTELPDVLDAKRIRITTPDGHVYVTISVKEAIPQEVFIHTPVDAKYAEIYESFARIFSTALRFGIPADALLEQLEKANQRYGSVASIPAAIIRAFHMSQLTNPAMDQQKLCPKCEQRLLRQENCLVCADCGWSKCS